MNYAVNRLSKTIFALVFGYCLQVTVNSFAQRDLKDIPDPDPEIERKSFIVADGFEVNLFAADPQIAKPIQMNFDADGRLWIASSSVYPHIKPGQKANDKILVLEDTDEDGQSDKTTVFADGLLIPTGVIPGDGGAYVANSTDLIHLRDTDADGRSDQKQIVLSGFGTEDTHHLLHTLRWGPDGCLYMNQSIYIHSHIETPYGVRRLNGGGIWRFRPESLELEVLCRGFVNPWGHHVDAWGQSFATDGAYGEGINYVFPGSVFVTAVGLKRRLQGLNPGSPKHCGLEILSGSHLPPEFRGNMITNDFRDHRVCRFVVKEDGAGYTSQQETELIKTKHVAFRPIDVKMGSDGAIYVADWYNPIIQHGEVDFRDPRRDHTHGRIWRITAKGRPLVKRPKITGADIPALLDLLKRPEDWVRQYVKLELKSRKSDDVESALTQWLEKLDPKAHNYEHHRLEALWVYECIGRFNPLLLFDLKTSADHRVRAAAVRVGSHFDPFDTYEAHITHKNPRVRLEAIRALTNQQSSEAAATAMQALDSPMDRFLDFALWQAMRDLEPFWLAEVKSGKRVFKSVKHLMFALQAAEAADGIRPIVKLIEANQIPANQRGEAFSLIAAQGGPQELKMVLDKVVADDSKMTNTTRVSLLNSLVDASRTRKMQPQGDLTGISKLLTSEDVKLAAVAIRGAGQWKLTSLRNEVKTRAEGETNVHATVREAAIQAIADYADPAAVQTLNRIATSDKTTENRVNAVNALSRIAPVLAARRAVDVLRDADGSVNMNLLLEPLLSRKNGPDQLIEALAGKNMDSEIAKGVVRVVRSSSQPSPLLVAEIQRAGNLKEASWKLTPSLLKELVDDVAAKGDAHRGELVYRRSELQCMKCHRIAGAGGIVGPDLISLGASAQVDYLIESLIDPNKKVKENFHSLVLQTDQGKIVSGIPIRRSDKEIVLRDTEDRKITIQTDSILAEKEGRSLMPEGLVNPLTRAELVDLVRFLSELGKVGDFAVGKARLARRWKALVWTPDGNRRLNRTSFDTAATNDPALTWRPAYSLVSGKLPLVELAKLTPHRNLDPTSFVRCQLEVTSAGRFDLNVNSHDGLQFWVDGKPTTISRSTVLNLDRGMHSLTLGINRRSRTEPVRLELTIPDVNGGVADFVTGK